MDTDGIAMKIAIVVILGVLTFLSYKWWKDQSIENIEAPMAPLRGASRQDPVPQEPGIIMYGSDECPWCTKQRDYFAKKNIEYMFIDCNVPGNCPNFVEGFPTIVKDGAVMPGYQEL